VYRVPPGIVVKRTFDGSSANAAVGKIMFLVAVVVKGLTFKHCIMSRNDAAAAGTRLHVVVYITGLMEILVLKHHILSLYGFSAV
jgi:hypothetical protein